MTDDPTDRFKGVVNDLERLNQLHKATLAHMAPYFLSRIKILNQPTSNRHRHSDPINRLQQGDIVIDRNRLMKTGSTVSALCRIVKLAPGKRVALVVHLKKGMRNNPDFLDTGKRGLVCKRNHAQPCESCVHTLTPTPPPLQILAVETAQLYFVALGPGNKADSSDESPNGHLAGPRVPRGGKRYLLPDP